MNSRNSEKDTRYIYVPFRKDEVSQDYIDSVIEFQETSIKNKEKKFIIIWYGECSLFNLPDNSNTYVMGHGIELSPDSMYNSALTSLKIPYSKLKSMPFFDWAYSIYGGKGVISIDTVAKRMIDDGILGTNNITIKLYFCDPNYKAYAIAKRFISHFSDYENNFRVDYYMGKDLYNPYKLGSEVHKFAYKDEKADPKGPVRASLIRKSLFNNKALNDRFIVDKDINQIQGKDPKDEERFKFL